MPHVLFVNNNPNDILPFIPYVEHTGAQISTANTLQEATSLLHHNKQIDIIIADTRLADGNSVQLLSMDTLPSDLRFFLMSEEAFDDKTLETNAHYGIQDYLVKPLTINRLKSILTASAKQKNEKSSMEFCHYDNIIGASTAMQTLYRFMHRVAKTSASVFIVGESGTGKELIAQAIQRHSLRADKPFIAVNCGAISSELIASALFGHEKGSFTGAVQAHTGYFEQASGGTLFLDEITETSQDFQIKLLRVLETGIVTPVGSKRQIEVDV